jgi:hypothetical protein
MRRGEKKKDRRERNSAKEKKTEEEGEDDMRKNRWIHERGEYEKGEA